MRMTQGARFKGALTLRVMRVQSRHLGVSATLNFVPWAPHASNRSPVTVVKPQLTSDRAGCKLGAIWFPNTSSNHQTDLQPLCRG